MDKEEYFRQLYALREASDGEDEGVNETRDFLNRITAEDAASISAPGTKSASISPPPPLPPPPLSRATEFPRKPTILAAKQLTRNLSDPVLGSNTVKGPPTLPRKTRSLRYDVFSPVTHPSPSDNSSVSMTTAAIKAPASELTNSGSSHNIGSVVMRNSTGITSMLGKGKRKRKDSTITLAPEKERIFAGKTFFYVPNDDVAPVRRTRITKARYYGATWTKEWSSSITHVVVDRALTYKDVMNFLKPLLQDEFLPSNIVLVNEEYPVECAQFRSLVDPRQKRYAVAGSDIREKQEVAENKAPQLSEESLVKGMEKQSSWIVPEVEKTPSQSQSQQLSTQMDRYSQVLDTALETGLQSQALQEANAVGHRQTVPLDENSKERDVLDEMIMAAKRLEHLPLDDEEEDEERAPSATASNRRDSDDSSEERVSPRKRSKSSKKGSFDPQSFSCMVGGTGKVSATNPNGHTIAVLQEMADYYERVQDVWRTRAYRQAIGTLKRQRHKVSTYEEAVRLPMVGERLALKIEEIVLTSRLRRLESARMEPSDRALQLFLQIYGVGLKQASKWVQAGFQSLEDLAAGMGSALSKNERIGIEHHADFNTRIPRAEVAALANVVKQAAAAIDPAVECILGGSYRRGAASSGDVDLILTRPGTASARELHPFLNGLTSRLFADGFLTAALAVSRRADGAKWHGACVLPGQTPVVWRRIDLLLVPATEIGAALIYFTGDDIFNRSIRLLASKKGLRLNQRGLYRDVLQGSDRSKMTEGTLLEGANERRIFEILGVPWRPPEERICH